MTTRASQAAAVAASPVSDAEFLAKAAATVTPPGRRATHVVVDGHDGYTFWQGAGGQLFDQAAAEAFAEQRNAEMKPEHRAYQVLALVPPAMAEYATRHGYHHNA
jgi:hypothetical protein